MSPAASDAGTAPETAPAAPAEPSPPTEPEPSPSAPAGTAVPAGAPAQPGHKLKVYDVVAHVEQFFATHPALDRALLTELKSGLLTLERFV